MLKVRIYYEDTDSGGVVYYANYLKFMERARTEWLRAFGYSQHQLAVEQKILFAVHSLQVNYIAPARLDDELLVECIIMKCSGASITFQQQIKLADKQTKLIEATVKIAVLDATTMRATRIPKQLMEKIKNAG